MHINDEMHIPNNNLQRVAIFICVCCVFWVQMIHLMCHSATIMLAGDTEEFIVPSSVNQIS